MPCKCLTGCINKKCSCRAKGMHCTDECLYCSMADKYECFNLPGKETPVTSKSKRNGTKKKSSKVNSDSDYTYSDNSYSDHSSSDYSENKSALVRSTSKDLTKSKKKEKNDENENENVIHQTVVINNYYNHAEYKQQNNAFTQYVSHTYGNTMSNNNNNFNNNANSHLLNNKMDLDMDITNGNGLSKNVNSFSAVPKLTQSLANDFLKFYWECLSTKYKTKFLEKYISPGAELKIQGTPFIGAKVITERLETAAPMTIDKMEFKLFPSSTPPANKFSVTSINKKLLPTGAKASISASTKVISLDSDSESETETKKENRISSNKDSVNVLLSKYRQNHSTGSINSSGESTSLVFTDPNLPAIGKIETFGKMRDCNGYTAEFIQNFYLVYNRTTNLVQIKHSELNWKS